MKILIVGNTSKLATSIISKLQQYDYVELLNNSGKPWRFGDKCHLDSFSECERIIFLAWDKNNLEISVKALNEVLRVNSKLRKPLSLLFISSFSIFNGTRYGVSKMLGEDLVNANNGSIIRSPLIFDNVSTFELKWLTRFVKIFRILPSRNLWGGQIHMIEIDKVISKIQLWIENPIDFQSPGLDSKDIKINSIHNIITNMHISFLEKVILVDFLTTMVRYLFYFFGSKSRIFDSFLSFFNDIDTPHRNREVLSIRGVE